MRRLVSTVLAILASTPLAAAAQIIPAPPPTDSKTAVVTADQQAADVGDLLPTVGERLGSSLQFSYGLSDLADFRADSSATDLEKAFLRNPDDTLWKGTTTLKMAALFTSVADLHDAYKSLDDYKKTFGFGRLADDPLRGRKTHDQLVEYFTRTGSSERFGRLMSAFTVSGSLLERAELDFGATGRPADATDGTKLSFDVTFDPSTLFVTATQRTQAFEALAAYLKAYPTRATTLRSVAPCKVDPSKRVSCITARSLAGLSVAKAIAASLIPSVKVESIDEFDYATIGGQPILFPETAHEGSLQTVTFTWDLLKIIKPSPARREAIAAGKALATLEQLRLALTTRPTIEETQVPALRAGVFTTVPLVATWLEMGENPVTWHRNAKGAWTIEGLYVTADGLLVGAPRCPSGTAPCSGVIAVTAKAADGAASFDRSLRIDVVP